MKNSSPAGDPRACQSVEQMLAGLEGSTPKALAALVRELFGRAHGLPPAVFVEACDQCSVAISIADAHADILYANRAFEQVTGYPRAELVGRNHSMLSFRTTPRGIYEEMWASLKAHRSWNGKLINRRKDGSRYLGEVSISPIVDGEGENLYFVGVHRDLTAVHHLEQQVASQKSLIERVIDLAPFAAVLLDDTRVVLDNLEYKKLHSLFRGEEPARVVLGSLFGETPAPERGDFKEREFVVERGGAPIRWYSCSGTWFDEADPRAESFFEPQRRNFLLLVMEDITEHKRRQEEQRIGSLRMLLAEGELNQSLRETISGAMFQMQGPLNMIEAALRMLERRGCKDPAALAGVLREALDAGESAIDRLRACKPPESRESAAPLNLNEIVRDVLSVSTEALLSAGVSVEWRPASVLPAIPGRATALRTLFKQLIDNALAAMVEARSAERELRVISEVTDDGVKVVVEDTGPGIPEEYRHKVFEPFFAPVREGGRKKPVRSGRNAGMGLALAQEVVARHAGSIRIDPAYTAGCRVEVFFPRGSREVS